MGWVDAGGGRARRARKRHESFLKKNGNPKYRIPIAGDRSRNGGYLLQRVAFPEAGATNQQILATVYVKNLPAHVSLKSAFSPEQAADLRLTVTVTGPTKEPDPSVLVVQCRSEQGKAKQPTAALWSESASRPQELGKVLVTSQVKTSWTDTFSCYTGLSERGETATAVLEGQDLNLSLPILEQNPNGPASLAAAPLYAETASTGGGIANLVEVPGTPGSPCPAASPPASSPPASSPSASASASPSAPASASASPSPSAAECYSPILPGSADTKYSFPTSVATAETLENVKLTDDRVDSMFPPGQIGASTVTWQGVSGLSPSMSATNLASASRQNKDAFWAGLLYGITAALAVPFLQCLPDAWKDTKAIYQALKAKAKDVQEHVEEERQEDPAVSSEPATGTT